MMLFAGLPVLIFGNAIYRLKVSYPFSTTFVELDESQLLYREKPLEILAVPATAVGRVGAVLEGEVIFPSDANAKRALSMDLVYQWSRHETNFSERASGTAQSHMIAADGLNLYFARVDQIACTRKFIPCIRFAGFYYQWLTFDNGKSSKSMTLHGYGYQCGGGLQYRLSPRISLSLDLLIRAGTFGDVNLETIKDGLSGGGTSLNFGVVFVP